MTAWSWAAIAAAVLTIGIAAVFIGLRRAKVQLVGPIFWYELVRLARRGTQPRLRALLVGLLLVGLLVAYLREFRGLEREALLGGVQLPLDRTARFAETFLIAFSSAQLLGVMLIAPAVVGGAVTEERERGTLDYLRASLLTNREIILGKLAARLTFVGGIVLAGVPVLALTFLFGGVDYRVVIGTYIITAVSAIALGAFAIYLAVSKEGLREVLVWVYGAVVALSLPGLCCGWCPVLAAISPPSTMLYMFVSPINTANPDEPIFWINLGVFSVIHLALAALFTGRAIVRIRGAGAQYRPIPKPSRNRLAEGEAPPWKPTYVPETRRERLELDWDSRPRVSTRRAFSVIRLKADSDPLLWKEQHFSGRLAWFESGLLSGCGVAVLSAVLFFLGLFIFIGVERELHEGRWPGGAVNGPLRVFGVGAVLSIGLAVGFRAAGAVARERQRQTLETLLTLPVSRRVLLRAKALAPLMWVRYGLFALLGTLVVGLFTGGVHPLGFVAMLVQTAALLGFLAALGIWLSVKCRTVNRATVFFLVWVLGIVFVPVLVAVVVPVLADVAELPQWGAAAAEVVRQLSPPVGLWNSMLAWVDVSDPNQVLALRAEAAGWSVAALLFGLAAVGLAIDAVRSFEKEGK